jgi:gliding motility-associated-like protein/uncharacterized repeat protein (TIGR01451 family)
VKNNSSINPTTMKIKLLVITIIAISLLCIPKINYGQAPNLGSTANFAVFTSIGAVTNAGIPYLTHITGKVGTDSDPTIPGFGNVDGEMCYGPNPASATATTDLLIASNQLQNTIPTFFPAPGLGNGQILLAGVDSVDGAATIDLDLILDAENDPAAVFIIKIAGSLSVHPNAKVKLINGAQACNVYWHIKGVVDLATNVNMKGTIIAVNAAITIAVGDTLEGRALSTNGAIGITSALIYTPIGCGSPILVGPMAPSLVSAACFTIFASTGKVKNLLDPTLITGDIGTNGASDSATGYNPLFVDGLIHEIPDAATAAAAFDLGNAYSYLNALPTDIILLRGDLFGHNLVLTPHTYLITTAVTFTDTLYLNAQGDSNAVFVINVNGAFETSTNSRVILTNGTQAKNVYWKIDGAVDINDYSIFNGTLICAGAINLKIGTVINGRMLTINGAINTTNIIAIKPSSIGNVAPPLSQTACVGSTVIFVASPSGPGITYQWRKGNDDIFGETNDSLIFNSVSLSDSASNYNVIISGVCSETDTTANFSLMIDSLPTITSQPTNQTGCIGDSIGFSAVATGSGLTYQWRKGTIDILGATSSTYFINPVSILDTASNYNVIVMGACLPNDTSINVSLTIGNAPVIISQPSNQIGCLGDSIGFSVTATGTGLTYQWRKGTVDILGAMSSTYFINPVSMLDTASNYNVIVMGGCMPNDTSINVSLTVDSLPTITAQPSNQVTCVGNSINFSVTATGSGLTYQWRKGTVDILGANASTFTINPVSISDTASNYNVIVMGTCLPNDTSINISLTIDSLPTITSQPTNQVACLGNVTSFSVTATGSGLTYQWRKGTVDILGANASTFTINPVSITDTASNYNVIVMGTCLPNDTSINVSLTIGNVPAITSQPSDQTVCEGSSVSFSAIATGTGLSYQWRKGTVDILGANVATFTINPVNLSDTASNYNVIVMGGCMPNDTSINVSLTVDSLPTIISQPTSQIACAGDSIGFSVTATGSGITYQWRKGSVDILGANASTFTINSVSVSDTASNYNVIVMGTCLPNDTSINVVLTVNAIPVAIANSNSPVCMDSTINLTAQSVLGATYAWTGPNGFSSPLQNPSINNASSTEAGTYSLTLINNGCTSVTVLDTVVVYNCSGADLAVVKTVNDSTPLIGSTVVFTITATNNGTNDATGVMILEMLESGYTYVSSTTTVGAYNSTTGVWTIGNLDSAATAVATITVTVNATGNYSNTASITGNETDDNLLNNTSTVTTVPTDFFIPEGFSPNGDGINDLFVIRGINLYTNNTFEIFNRWGNKVFGTNNYQNTWNGLATEGVRMGGNELPVGTYFYVLDLKDGTPIFKGTIYLNR